MTAIAQAQDADAERLIVAIQHGDDEHRAWLREAITAFYAGQPIPAPRGSGNKEKRIAELEAEVARLSVTTPDTTVLVEQAWEELRDSLNKEHREGVISYRELKAAVNAAGVMRRAALSSTANPTGAPE